MRKKLQRAPKVAGVPVNIATAKSLSRAAADMLMNKRATLTERERRYNICLKCPERNNDRCTLCGCFVKTKTILKNSKCPIDKWSTLVSEPSIDDASTAESDE